MGQLRARYVEQIQSSLWGLFDRGMGCFKIGDVMPDLGHIALAMPKRKGITSLYYSCQMIFANSERVMGATK